MGYKFCGAKAKSNGGQPCRAIALSNGRCHYHGGRSTGPRTEAGKLRNKLHSLTNGLLTREAIEERRRCNALRRETRAFLDEVNKTLAGGTGTKGMEDGHEGAQEANG